MQKIDAMRDYKGELDQKRYRQIIRIKRGLRKKGFGMLLSTCEWRYDPLDYYWTSDCGRDSATTDGCSPIAHGYRFCPFCGRRLAIGAAKGSEVAQAERAEWMTGNE